MLRKSDGTNLRDRDHHVRRRPALHIKQPAMNHLLALERDIGGRLIGVGIELDAAHAITGRDRDDADGFVPRRRSPRRVDAEPPRSVRARIADGYGMELVDRR